MPHALISCLKAFLNVFRLTGDDSRQTDHDSTRNWRIIFFSFVETSRSLIGIHAFGARDDRLRPSNISASMEKCTLHSLKWLRSSNL